HRDQVDKRVPVIGRAGDDSMDVVALHELAKVLVLFGHLTILGKLLGGSFGMAVIHVADGDHVSVRGGTRAVAAALTATTNERDARPVVRTERLGLGGMGFFEFEEPSWHSGGGRDGRGGLDKATASDVENLRWHERIARHSPECVKTELVFSRVGNQIL